MLYPLSKANVPDLQPLLLDKYKDVIYSSGFLHRSVLCRTKKEDIFQEYFKPESWDVLSPLWNEIMLEFKTDRKQIYFNCNGKYLD